ncbi:arylamine N-acetyltransferase family protein [Amycolatopsis sp. H20-H5]|uniref:arylamine N-acetyltransferase family protein n=1 Tax=Amycolatopsis sp. H20-H5 TaxID=3046309 RepID=UPI002DBDD6D9|nr:arylamine N-acetyltransferase [Amycolatopsis sp. H20-H5]MEC3982335.1 arylamine N-acetyltransferase [Amycolatopsis sp. H20-H5]
MRIDVHAYLARLGLDREPTGVTALHRLHAAHVERVPYEALEVQLGRVTTLEPADSLARILRGRGGYCFHLNGAFSALLAELGYQVTRHHGGVQANAGDTPGADLGHLALTVSGVPGDDGPGWLVDVGLGDGIHLPLPLREGTYEQGPFTYRLGPSEVEPGGWRFDHDTTGSFVRMDFRPGTAAIPDFTTKHHELSTSPRSGFVRVSVLQRRDADGVDTLRALTLGRTPGAKTVLERPADWEAAIRDVFGIPLTEFTPAERERLFRQAAAQHEAHLAKGSSVRPSA